MNVKPSPKPRETEGFNDLVNGSESNNKNDTAVFQVGLVKNGEFTMPTHDDGTTITYGYFGDLTEKAVKSFQTDLYSSVGSAQKNLVNGVGDSATWKALGLPLDKNGQPDRNSEVYKKLLKVATERRNISVAEFNTIIGKNKGINNVTSQTASMETGKVISLNQGDYAFLYNNEFINEMPNEKKAAVLLMLKTKGT